ncbi:MAG TPA: quinolinate synthase NadA [Kiritimatiellae bacterium]|nr:quinolinate synthase NadA [Kiritimatiellia bacterium]
MTTARAESIYRRLVARLGRVLPEMELRHAAEVAAEIERLKVMRQAVVVAHNYMEPALYYSVADLTGDSLDLSRRLKDLQCRTVVFCGVRFMAESAAILAPDRQILIPSPRAGCSLAESITAEDVRNLKAALPEMPVVSYVNTYAEVKAESDICCTSSNAAAVLRKLGEKGIRRVIFLPDEYLARNTAGELGWNFVVVGRNENGGLDGVGGVPGQGAVVVGWRGRCEVHERFTVADVENARRQFPDVTVLAHPECPPEVVEAADFSGSTNAMISYVERNGPRRLLLLTECSMGDNIQAANPDVEIVRLCTLRCPHMNEVTLEQTRWSLENMEYRVTVEDTIAEAAARSLEGMIAFA